VTLHEFIYPEDKTARRITSLHEVPTSESEDDNEIPSVPGDCIKSLEKRLGEKRLIELIF
jgi:hypothetical protein